MVGLIGILILLIGVILIGVDLIEEITNRNIKTKQASRIRLVKSNY